MLTSPSILPRSLLIDQCGEGYSRIAPPSVGTITIMGCHYTETMGTDQGTQVYSITGGMGVTVANSRAVSNNYDASGLTFYTTGLKCGNAHYAVSGDEVSLRLGPRSASEAIYSASAGTLTGSDNPYTLTMPAENVVINMTPLQAIGASKWYVISTPMHDDGQSYESIANVTNLTGTAYDLFRYNEGSGTWENYKASHADFTTLTPGRGYIYRCSDARTLTYTGVPNSEDSYSVSLTASGSSDLKGFNLVGNPYPFRVKLDRSYYSLNADGTWTAHPDGDSLEVGQGTLVYTTTNNEMLTFYAATRSTNASATKGLPPLPKGLCLGDDCDGDGPDADEDVRAPRFAYWERGRPRPHTTSRAGCCCAGKLRMKKIRMKNSDFPSAGVYILRLGGQSQKIVITR